MFRLFGFATILALSSTWAESEFTYIARLGLNGEEFTSPIGQQSTYVYGLSDSGYLYGISSMYGGPGPAPTGQAVWAADTSGATTRIGFYDQNGGNQFTSSTGSQYSEPENYNNDGYSAGYVTGYSTMFNGGANTLGYAAWVANPASGTVRVGLYDQNGGNEFTASTGSQSSRIWSSNEAGVTTGWSARYLGGTPPSEAVDEKGYAAWVATASGVTKRVGYFDQDGGNQFTRSDGFQASYSSFVTESGHVAGVSYRYDGKSDSVGRVAWIATASGATTRIGLYDQDGGNRFTSSTGSQYSSTAADFAESGYVLGVSSIYNGLTDPNGTAAWVANPSGATARVGLYDQSGGNQFTRSDDFQNAEPYYVNESGYATGRSQRFNGTGSDLGWATWVADSTGQARRIGLYDQAGGNEFSRNDGYQDGYPASLSNSGHVAGNSSRYKGTGNSMGNAAWLAESSGATIRIGFYDQGGGNAFTRDDGYQDSYMDRLTDSGYAIGGSTLYNGETVGLGQAAWIANTSGTTRIGLYDEQNPSSPREFTTLTGAYRSFARDVTESGLVIGESARYLADSSFGGNAAWVATSSGTTTRIGLLDAVHTSASGIQSSGAAFVTESGFVAGSSTRYNGDETQDGQTAWLFDLSSGETVPFELSVRPSDGFAFSSVIRLTEEGLALGYYALFDGEASLGDRAFAYLPGRGFFDIGSNLDSPLDSAGWDYLANAFLGNSDGFIVGQGDPLGSEASSQGVYLVQAVPEASTSAFLGLGFAVLTTALWRQKQSKNSFDPRNLPR
ncbi:MAG TPA: hypothetical protein VIS96_04265 [Terrimicrobiaceae bacterium]